MWNATGRPATIFSSLKSPVDFSASDWQPGQSSRMDARRQSVDIANENGTNHLPVCLLHAGKLTDRDLQSVWYYC
jgi:hypothetical protein